MSSLTRRYVMLKQNNAAAEKHKCQKCLQYGHWTYECTNKRKYLYRESRTKKLAKKMKNAQSEAKVKEQEEIKNTEESVDADNEKEESEKSSSSSSEDSSDSSSSSSDSSSEDSSSSSGQSKSSPPRKKKKSKKRSR